MGLQLSLLFLWLTRILWMSTGVMAATLPEKRIDAIGAYKVSNWWQCQRLCWYRQPCSSFSHTAAHRTTNCVLHSSQFADNMSDEASPSDWTETAASQPSASGSAGSHACDVRPCDPSSFCIPRWNGGHSCSPVAAVCGVPDVVANGDVDASLASRGEGSKATVACHQDFVQSPKDTPMEIECQANGRWTSFPGECVQAVFQSPSRGVAKRIPWSLTPGWKACMEGVFDNENRMTFNFFNSSDANADIAIHLDFRRSWAGNDQEILVNYEMNGQWQTRIMLDQPPMTLQPGDNFTLTVEVTSTFLRLTVNDDVYEVALSSIGLDLAKARYLRYNDCRLSYLNLAGGCAEFNF